MPAGVVANATAPTGATATFTVTATDNHNGVTVACTPASASEFAIGTTIVTCTATDAAGNSTVASFPVRVKDAAEQMNDLAAAVGGAMIPFGLKTALLAKLDAALAHFHPTDAAAVRRASTLLEAFSTLVENAEGAGLISSNVGNPFVDDATRIQAVLG